MNLFAKLITLRKGCVIFFFALAASAHGAPPPTNITANGFGTSVNQNGMVFNITGGSQPSGGSNLFHSFSTFNLGTGNTADFDVNGNVTNVFARVTGGSSSIDGTIKSTIGSASTSQLSKANFFFINPAGTIFTRNAHLDLGGSFTVSTANSVRLKNGSVFYADINHPTQDAGLTTAPLAAFGFMNPVTQPTIAFKGCVLRSAPGAGINIIGGNILEAHAHLFSRSGGLTMFSTAGAGKIPFGVERPGKGFAKATISHTGLILLQKSENETIGRAPITIKGGKLAVDKSSITSVESGAVNGSGVSVTAGKINLYGEIASIGKGSSIASAVTVNSKGQLNILNGGLIQSGAFSTGASGDVVVNADSLSINGASTEFITTGTASGIFSSSFTGAGAPPVSGSVMVKARKSISLTNGGQISTSTYTSQNAGSVTVRTRSLSASAVSPLTNNILFAPGISSDSAPGATGNAGVVKVNVHGTLSLQNGAKITSTTFTSANANAVSIRAEALYVDGVGSNGYSSGIYSDSGDGASGNAGMVNVNVSGPLSVSAGGELSSSTDDNGEAGLVYVRSGSLSIDGIGSNRQPSGIFSVSYNEGASGEAGNVDVFVSGALSIENRGVIESSTHSAGGAGNVRISAGSLSIQDPDNLRNLSGSVDGGYNQGYFTGISSDSAMGATGPSGTVGLEITGGISLHEGAVIDSSTFSNGNAGAVTITAGNIDARNSGIFSDSYAGSGSSGLVTINVAGNVSLTNCGQISSSTYNTGTASGVTLTAGSLNSDGQGRNSYDSGIFSVSGIGASGNAGDVNIGVAGPITLTGGSELSSSTAVSGNAGSVSVSGSSLTVNGQDTFANPSGILSVSYSSSGNAGPVSVDIGGAIYLTNGGQLNSSTMSSGTAGNVTVQAGSLNIDGVGANDLISGIFSKSTSNGGTGSFGDAGQISVSSTGAVILTNGGQINSSTTSNGLAGSVILNSSSLAIDGIGSNSIDSGIFSQAGSGSGAAGQVTVLTGGAISLTNGGQISCTTYTLGSAGGVTVNAAAISIDGTANGFNNNFTPSGISSDSVSGSGIGGSAGKITVSAAGVLSLTNGGRISSSTFTTGNSGDVVIRTGSLSIDGEANGKASGIFSDSTSNPGSPRVMFGNAGLVSVDVAGSVSLINGGQISSSTYSNGSAGDVSVSASTLSIDGLGLDSYDSGIVSVSGTGATGSAGNINVQVAGPISITNGGEISSSTDTIGAAGDVTVSAQTLLIEGTGNGIGMNFTPSAVSSDSVSGLPSGGNAGKLTVNVAGAVSLLDGGELSTQGNGGDVALQASSLQASGTATFSPSGIISDISVGTGMAGQITLAISGPVSLADGAQISSSTSTTALAGDINVQSDSLLIDGEGYSSGPTGIFSNAKTGSTQDAGQIDIALTGPLSIENLGAIETNTSGLGNAGDINISTSALTIEDPVDFPLISGSIDSKANQRYFTGVSSGSLESATGQAGKVFIHVSGPLQLFDGGVIDSSSFSPNNAGDVSVSAGNINLTYSGIFSQNEGSGNAGDVSIISTGSLQMDDNSSVSSSSLSSRGGSVNVNIADNLIMNDSSIDTSAATSGGDITLNVGHLAYLLNSNITTAAGQSGGNIFFTSKFLALNNSSISANAALGQGGNITIDTSYYLNSGTPVTATGATSGTITISSPPLDLGNALVGLPAALENEAKRLRAQCDRSLKHETSSFIVVGRGGIEPPPEELQSDFGFSINDPLPTNAGAK